MKTTVALRHLKYFIKHLFTNTYIYKYIFNTTYGEMRRDILNHEDSYLFLPFHASVFIFLNLFGNILKQSKLKWHCNFQQHTEGAPKAQKLSGTLRSGWKTFLLWWRGRGPGWGRWQWCVPRSQYRFQDETYLHRSSYSLLCGSNCV